MSRGGSEQGLGDGHFQAPSSASRVRLARVEALAMLERQPPVSCLGAHDRRVLTRVGGLGRRHSRHYSPR